jgi:acetyltransferase-like isoleucine patch superfamily enzyme
MHNLYKVSWGLRAVLYKMFFGCFLFPGYIGPPTFLLGLNKIFLMRKVRIFPGLRAEVHGNGKLIIHENVTIGQNFHVTCMSELNIRSGTIISGDAMITDIDHEYRNTELSVIDQPHLPSKTDIGENCFIGMGARLQAGTVLGKGCVVGANSVVRGEFPEYSVIVGAPGRVVKQYNAASGQWERH